MIQKRYIFIGLFSVIFIADIVATNIADDNIRARGADFKEHFSTANFKYPPRNRSRLFPKDQCKFKYELLIYGYQTCFHFYGWGAENRRGYHYVYTPPKRKLALFFRGDGPDNYYFKEFSASGNYLKFVREDGKILEGNWR